MTELIICSAAEADFSAALNWYATHSPQAAANFDEEVSRAIVAISFDPERLPACDKRHRFYLLKTFPYQIVFRREGFEWIVIAIAHTARSGEFWRSR